MSQNDSDAYQFPPRDPDKPYHKWVALWPSVARSAVLPFKLGFTVSDCLYLKGRDHNHLLALGIAWSRFLVVFVKSNNLDEEQFCHEINSFINDSASLQPDCFISLKDGHPVIEVAGEQDLSTRAGFLLLDAIDAGHITSDTVLETIVESVTSVLLLKAFSSLVLRTRLYRVNGGMSTRSDISCRVVFSLPCSLSLGEHVFIHFEPPFKDENFCSLAVTLNEPGDPALHVTIHVKGTKIADQAFISAVLAGDEGIEPGHFVLTDYPSPDELELLLEECFPGTDITGAILAYDQDYRHDFLFFTRSFDPGPRSQLPYWWEVVAGTHAERSREATGLLVLHSLASFVKMLFAYFDEEGFWNNPFEQVIDKEPEGWDGNVPVTKVTASRGGEVTGKDMSWRRSLFPPRYTLFDNLLQLFPGEDPTMIEPLPLKTSVQKHFPPVRSWRVAVASEVIVDDFFELPPDKQGNS